MRAIPYSRMAFFAKSSTRRGVMHLVDFEGFGRAKIVCTCEDFLLGGNKACKHITSATIPMNL